MTRRERLNAKQREDLWDAEAAKAVEQERGEYPICKLCDLPITPGSLWHANHQAHKPRWLGGNIDGISHARCNRIHNNTHDTPLYARNERVRKRFMDFTRTAHPLPGGRDDDLKKKINGEVEPR